MVRKITALAVFVAVSLPLCAEFIDGVAAEVGGDRITFSEVQKAARQIAVRDDSISDVAAYGMALTNLVSRKLIVQKQRKSMQKFPDWVVQRRVDALVDENFGGDRSQLVEMLRDHGMSFAEWRKGVEEDMIYSAMRREFVTSKVTVSPAEIEAAYNSDYKSRKLPGHVRLALIMAKQDALPLAEASNIVSQIRSGADFATFARKHSTEPHAENGGDFGYVEPADELRGEIVEVLSKLKVGEVSDPVSVAPDYVCVVKKIDERADLSIPLEAVRDEVEDNLRRKAEAARFTEWVKSLWAESSVRLYDRK